MTARANYRKIRCKSALNAVCDMMFRWPLNPYGECVHGCLYCDSRRFHSAQELREELWSRGARRQFGSGRWRLSGRLRIASAIVRSGVEGILGIPFGGVWRSPAARLLWEAKVVNTA
jgi:hypothetical protein